MASKLLASCQTRAYPLYLLLVTENKNPPNETITFLGTGGARFMIITQLLASGGMWLNLDGTQILLDPGPGCIIQSIKRKLNAQKLSAIIISHRHLDHAADVNIMVEAMTESGFNRHGRFFAPADALGPEPVLFSYLHDYLDGIEILEEGKSYTIDNIELSTPVRHIHRVETYGLRFQTPHHTFSYIADTRYFEGLMQYAGSELLIMNVVFLEPRTSELGYGMPVDHLSVPDAACIIKELKPKTVIMTHFGMSMWRGHPWEIAERLTQQTGIKVIAARDGMTFDLAKLESGKE